MAEPWEHHLSADKQTLRVPKAESFCDITLNENSLHAMSSLNKMTAPIYSYINSHKRLTTTPAQLEHAKTLFTYL